jgi:uncharacterized protein YjbJ (UPF0337 family)
MDKDKMKGKGEQIAGRAQEKAGETIGDEDLADRGRGKQAKGDAREAYGGVKDALKKAKDKVKDAARDVRR